MHEITREEATLRQNNISLAIFLNLNHLNQFFHLLKLFLFIVDRNLKKFNVINLGRLNCNFVFWVACS